MKKLFSLVTFVLLGIAALALVPSKAYAVEAPVVHARYQGDGHIYVWWTPVADATYQLFYGPKDNPVAHGVVLGTGTNYTVSALFRNTSYTFSVKSVRGNDVSGLSNTAWVTIGSAGRVELPPQVAQPQQPVGMTDGGFLSLRATPGPEVGTVTLYWNEPTSGASSYNVVYTDDPSMEKWGATNLSGSTRWYTIRGLVSGRRYWIWMSTRDSGMTPWVSVVAR